MEFLNKHYGWLKCGEDSEQHETVFLDGEPIAEVLDYLSNEVVTVRYYISDKEATEEELQQDFLVNTLYGNLESDYGARYSEITGYLWTDDELKVGGHDLLNELESYDEKYIFIIVEIDREVYEEKQERKRLEAIQHNKWRYDRQLYELISAAKNRDVQKNIDEVIKDLASKW